MAAVAVREPGGFSAVSGGRRLWAFLLQTSLLQEAPAPAHLDFPGLSVFRSVWGLLIKLQETTGYARSSPCCLVFEEGARYRFLDEMTLSVTFLKRQPAEWERVVENRVPDERLVCYKSVVKTQTTQGRNGQKA